MTIASVVRPGRVVVRLLLNLGRVLRDALIAPLAARVVRDWIVIRLDRGLTDLPSNRAWLRDLFPAARPLSSLLESLRRAADDPRVRGVLLRVGRAEIGWSKLTSLARALKSLRDAGKQVVVYADSTGNAGGVLGAGADQFWMSPQGRLDLIGVRVDGLHLRRLLDRLHVRPEVISAGRYKAAGEMISHDSMSAAAREALEPVVDELYETLVSGLVAGPCEDADEARRWIDDGPYLASEAAERGLVDDLIYSDEIAVRLAALERPGAAGAEAESASGDDLPKAKLIAESRYERVSAPRFVWTPLRAEPQTIAVVGLRGVIQMRDAAPQGIIGLLRRLARDDGVTAVVLRIDSPGGDALASDLIWRAVTRLVEAKPVVASFGDVAASGGYYVGMAANEIVAEPTTLTGSIGVVLAGISIDGLLDEIGVSFDGIARGRHARIYDATRERSQEERALLKRHVATLYRDFVAKAATGRGLTDSELALVAEGRIWTGAQAAERGLVDCLGGLDTAIDRARALSGLAPGAGEVTYLSWEPGRLERLLRRDPQDVALDLSRGAQFLCPIHVPLQ